MALNFSFVKNLKTTFIMFVGFIKAKAQGPSVNNGLKGAQV
jgi:hypothetical protein